MIRNQIEDIVKQLTAPPGYNTPSFLYGTGSEVNLLIDQSIFPLVVLYNVELKPMGYTVNNSISDGATARVAFLFQTEFDQFTSQNELYVLMAKQMAQEFMVKLSNYRETPYAARYFKVHVNDQGRPKILYNELDVNSTGISIQLDLSTMGSTNIPLP